MHDRKISWPTRLQWLYSNLYFKVFFQVFIIIFFFKGLSSRQLYVGLYGIFLIYIYTSII
jgi:hypothetical protein